MRHTKQCDPFADLWAALRYPGTEWSSKLLIRRLDAAARERRNAWTHRRKPELAGHYVVQRVIAGVVKSIRKRSIRRRLCLKFPQSSSVEQCRP